MKTSVPPLRRTLALLAALSFALALTACGRSSSSPGQDPASSSGVSSADSQAVSSLPVSSPALTATPAPENDGLEEILDGLLGFGPGTAGSSLSCVGRAADLLNWSSANKEADPAATSLRIEAWYVALSVEEKENVAESWPMVKDAADSLINDPEGNAPILADAGAHLDPAQPDGDAFGALSPLLDQVILGQSS